MHVVTVGGLELALAEQGLATYLLAVARTAGFVLVAPPFATRGVPGRVRAAYSLFLALPVASAMGGTAPALDSAELALGVLGQVVAGAALGYLVMAAVAAVGMAGDVLDLVGGFQMTQSMDPLMLTQTSVMGKLHQMMALTLLMASDGHLLVLRGLTRSTELMPTPALDLAATAAAVTAQFSATCLAALQIVAPVLAAVVITDLALGLLARAAPALNAFSLGFPLKILFTLMLAGLIVTHVPAALEGVVHAGLTAAMQLFRG